MGQLKDDCFTHAYELTPLDTALDELETTLKPVVGMERILLSDALSRVLAEDVRSDRNVPPHDNSAVDGYAVFF